MQPFNDFVMNNRRAYDIAFVGLKPGIHEYQYTIEDKFFADYTEPDFTNVQANVKLTLEKNAGFMLLKFEVGGTVESQCDRCGNPLTIQLWDEFNIVVKMVENPDEMNESEEDPDVYYISYTESHLNVADWIYEFISLSVPMQKTCGKDEQGNSLCNQEALEKLGGVADTTEEADEEPPANPIWKGLDKFKDLN